MSLISHYRAAFLRGKCRKNSFQDSTLQNHLTDGSWQWMWLFWFNLPHLRNKEYLELIVKSCSYYWLIICLWVINILLVSYFLIAIWPHGTCPYQSDFRLQTLQCQTVTATSAVPLLKFLYTKYSVSSSRWETVLCSETKFKLSGKIFCCKSLR